MTDAPARHARRAALYGYVATAVQYPDEAVVEDLRDPEVRAAVREAGRELDLADAVRSLLAALEGTDREALAAGYDALFGLPDEDGTYAVVPYEAEYTTEGDVGESQRRIATVVGLLERFGLTVGDDFDERHDHLAVELELSQVIAAQRAVALSDGEDEDARRLARAGATVLDEHLAAFVPAVADRVADRAEGGEDGDRPSAVDVYAAATALAAELVRRDRASHPEPVADGREVSADG